MSNLKVLTLSSYLFQTFERDRREFERNHFGSCLGNELGRESKVTLMVTSGATAGMYFPLYIVSFLRSTLFNLD